MRVAFRTDASIDIGNGHVMRCLTLASELREQGSTCIFVCRLYEGNLIEKIKKAGFYVVVLPDTGRNETKTLGSDNWINKNWETDAIQTLEAIGSDIDWMVVDHYGIGIEWEVFVRRSCRQVLVIDDLANRPHDADMLLDQNVGRTPGDYSNLVPKKCRVLAGPQHALLRNEFGTRRQAIVQRHKVGLRHILINMGGVDQHNASATILRDLTSFRLPEKAKITVVLGPHAPHTANVRQIAKMMPWPTKVLIDVEDMAALMEDCDLAIGAAGISALERCCIGLPSIIIPVADNQIAGAHALAGTGSAILASLDPFAPSSVKNAITQFLNSEVLQSASLACASITDGSGTKNLAAIMLDETTPRLRPMRESDLDQVLVWRNTLEIRRCMIHSEEISPKTHTDWFQRHRDNPDRALLIAEAKGHPFGFVQFTGIQTSSSPEWGFYVAPGAPKGSGNLLGRLALEYAFNTLGLHCITGRSLPENQASIRFHERLGFRPQEDSEVREETATLLSFELLRVHWEDMQGVTA
jgi:UDP-2,4-diacetamido-2,4,6-trideoxy-beta-L-altropyranose hydrolase